MLIFNSPPTTTFKVGTEGAMSISISDPSAKIAESGSIPSGLALSLPSSGAATLHGTPSPGAGGVFKIVLTAKSATASVSQDFELTVNEAPAFTSSDTIWDTVLLYDESPITVRGYPVPVITESGQLPCGLQFVNNGNASAKIFGTPEICWKSIIIGDGGLGGEVTLTASNSVGSVNQTVELNILGGG
jgi:hypothetical protein